MMKPTTPVVICAGCEAETDLADTAGTGNYAEWVCERINCGTWNYVELVPGEDF